MNKGEPMRRHTRRDARPLPWRTLLTLLLLSTPAAAQPGSAAAEVRLERLLTLGSDFGASEATFVDVAGVAAGPSGEVYVLDSGDKAVKVYNEAGRFIRRFGRQGGGPGEFQLPVSMVVDSVVRVSDLALHRMTYFTLDGRHLRTSGTTAPSDLALLRVMPLRHAHLVGVTPTAVGVNTRGRTGSPYAAVVFARASGAVDTVLRPHSGVAIYHPRNAQVPLGLLQTHAGRGGAHAVLGDSIVATADGYTGEVRWYWVDRQGLTLFRTRQLQSRSRPVTPDDIRRMERDVYAKSPDFPRRLVIEPPPRISIATEALFAPDGSLWIRNTGGSGHAHVWTVFNPAGEVNIRLSLPAGFDLYHVRGDRLYGVARTENDAPVVQVYRLARG
jgi:hypothetical protein